jgi:hypothetical protein
MDDEIRMWKLTAPDGPPPQLEIVQVYSAGKHLGFARFLPEQLPKPGDLIAVGLHCEVRSVDAVENDGIETKLHLGGARPRLSFAR